MLLQDLLQAPPRDAVLRPVPTNTALPSPPLACGRSTRNRWPSLVARAPDAKAGSAIGLAAGLARGRSGADTGEVSPRCRGRRRGRGALAASSGRRADGGQALLGAAAMLFEVPGDEDFDGTAIVGIKHAAIDQVPRRSAVACRDLPDPEGVDGVDPGRSAHSAMPAIQREGRGRHPSRPWSSLEKSRGENMSPRTNPRRSAEATRPPTIQCFAFLAEYNLAQGRAERTHDRCHQSIFSWE